MVYCVAMAVIVLEDFQDLFVVQHSMVPFVLQGV